MSRPTLPNAVLTTLHSPAGDISISHTAPAEPRGTLLLLHSNSLSSLIFHDFFASSFLVSHCRLIAFDLPGHGLSADAAEPETTYTQQAYSHIAVHVLEAYNASNFVVLGWSLGGHVAIEMIALCHRHQRLSMKGAMLVGSPPVPLANPSLGFRQGLHMASACAVKLSEEEAIAFAEDTVGARGRRDRHPEWILSDVKRTDGKAREVMFRHFVAGTTGRQETSLDVQPLHQVPERGTSQLDIVNGAVTDESGSSIGEALSIAVVNGSDEPFVDLRWVRDNVNNNRLWQGRCIEIAGYGHAPFWEDWKLFEPLLFMWLEDCWTR